MTKYEKISLALAGIVQSATLVYELANHGNCSSEFFEVSINSIYKIKSASLSDIYGGNEGLKLGLIQIQRFLGDSNQSFPKDIIRYVNGILILRHKLQKDKLLLTQLRERLELVTSQSEYFTPYHDQVLNNLASIYSDILGQFRFRIIVKGKEEYLQSDDIIHKIRALLLAGIRSAVLWHQIGGARWQIVVRRKHILNIIKNMLRKLTS